MKYYKIQICMNSSQQYVEEQDKDKAAADKEKEKEEAAKVQDKGESKA